MRTKINTKKSDKIVHQNGVYQNKKLIKACNLLEKANKLILESGMNPYGHALRENQWLKSYARFLKN